MDELHLQIYGRTETSDFGEQLSALAACFKETFGGEEPHFFYTVPEKTAAPKIPGKSAACTAKSEAELVDLIVAEAYR